MNTATAMNESDRFVALSPGFSLVPETILPNGLVVPAFQVGETFCCKGADGVPYVNTVGTPWTNVTRDEAIAACAAAGGSLIRNSQALAIAHDIASTAANWTGGAVGKGKLRQGLRKWTISGAQPATFVSPDADEGRWFILSNGSRICDAAGHLYTHVFDDIDGDERGLVARAFSSDSPSVAGIPFKSGKRGMGYYPSAGDDWSGVALLRGGCWGSEVSAGVFGLGGVWPDHRGGGVGFRCTKPA